MYPFILRFALYMTLALRLLILYRNIREELTKHESPKLLAKIRNKKGRRR